MKNPTTKLLFGCIVLFGLISCTKSKEIVKPDAGQGVVEPSFTEYIIQKGAHYSQQNGFFASDYTELKFSVKFDSSAIYSTASTENQYDINKLFGFADNGGSHLEFSARIGWRWNEGALRLFGFTHNNSEMTFQELSAVSIGDQHECSIKISGNTYIFSVDGKSISMPRNSSTTTAKGYKLFPYFGGDEVAPHEIRIWIREK